MFINTAQEIKDAEGNTWSIEIDSEGEVDITTPCDGKITLKAGRKGKFFSDLLKAYKKAAKAVNIYDSTKEEAEKKKKVKATTTTNTNTYSCTGCTSDVTYTSWCEDCTTCVYCCDC